jgi:hypothetical protein
MKLVQAGFQRRKLIRCGFEQQERFVRSLNLALPAVDGMNGGQQRGTGGEALIDQRAAEPRSFIGIGNGGHHNTSGRRGFEHKASPGGKVMLRDYAGIRATNQLRFLCDTLELFDREGAGPGGSGSGCSTRHCQNWN